jgi:arginine N-succinyltransferase
MMVIRPVTMNDVSDILTLASKTGTGLTTLPNSEKHIRAKVQNSINAFNKTEGKPSSECYLLVLEDTKTNQVVGTSGVVAAVGSTQPFYTYKLNTEVHYSKSMDIYRKLNFLTLTNDFTDASEICTLFLSPDYRGGGNGQLLSKSRFMLMAQFNQRFGDKVIAEMRGYSDENGQSPFWESVGRHFFGIDFDTADRENGQGNQQFIAELMPHHPVYIPMLSEQAQAVLGHVHPQTKPALQMLKSEGLRYTGYVDIFDAGPTIESSVEDIKTINQSFEVEVVIASDNQPTETPRNDTTNASSPLSSAMISNTKLKEFRCCHAKLAAPVNEKIQLPADVASCLEVNQGEKVRVRFY